MPEEKLKQDDNMGLPPEQDIDYLSDFLTWGVYSEYVEIQ